MDNEHNDTRKYQTHAEWCIHLFNRGTLAESHRRCMTTPYCVAPTDWYIRKGKKNGDKMR